MKKNNYRYEVGGRNGYHGIDLYDGESCVEFINSFKSKKVAESVCSNLNQALKLGGK